MSLFKQTMSMYLCALLLLISLPSSLSFYLPDSSPLLNLNSQVRKVHLYTDNQRRGMYLQMSPDGGVSGSDAQTLNSVMELKSIKPGDTIIKGHSSSLYLCVDNEGRLRGQRQYTEADCTFRELLLADGYTRFLSSHHGVPVSLASKQSPDRLDVPFTRFLPLRNTLAEESASDQPPNNERHFNVDSDDLFGTGLNTLGSPQFSPDY